jgi:hypothetical protein
MRRPSRNYHLEIWAYAHTSPRTENNPYVSGETMNRLTTSALAAALLLTVNAHSAFAADPVHTPAITQTAASADLIERSSQAVRQYVHGPVADVWVFPTADANTVFVRYTVDTSEHLLLVEMKGDQIATLRDFTTEVTGPATAVARVATSKAP